MYWVKRVEAFDWIKNGGTDLHLDAFGQFRSKELETIDFALCAFRGDEMTGYVTCIEMDSETVYWQLGGAPSYAQKSMAVLPSYQVLVEWCLERYQRITTRIENTNRAMLHMAMKMGFLIVGTWNFKGKIYLELLNEKEQVYGG